MNANRGFAITILILALLGSSCTTGVDRPGVSASDDNAAGKAIASLRQELQDVHRRLDIGGFVRLHTESGILEWQGLKQPVVGHAALEANRREVWAGRRDLTLQLNVALLNIHRDHAYEFALFTERWVEPDGSRVTEIGRYVTVYAVDHSGRWRIARIFGFTDSVDKKPLAQ